MKQVNVEIKARCVNHGKIRNILRQHHAVFKGTDHQIDTYFKVKVGRLKLREGNIENALIYYIRDDTPGPKQSNILLHRTEPRSSLKEILIQATGILAVVDKTREIYFIGNVKFHLDTIKQLGTFVEIEAIDEDGSIGMKRLREQCARYIKLFQLSPRDFLTNSYSDMVL